MTTTCGTRDQAAIRVGGGSARAILAAGATPLLGRRLQEDALLDTDDEQLRRRRCVLRVRTENGKSRLTFKGPVQPATMKVREEVETLVGDGEVLLRVLHELGLHVWFRYEKFREEFATRTSSSRSTRRRSAYSSRSRAARQGITQMAEALGRDASGLYPRLVPRPVSAAPRGIRLDRRGHGVRVRAE